MAEKDAFYVPCPIPYSVYNLASHKQKAGENCRSAAACADTSIDCGATGSVEKAGAATHKDSTESKGPRLGIDIDPWIVPSTF